MRNIKKSLIALTAMLLATSAMAFPTKVKLTKDPDFASSEGTQVVVHTNKGTVTISDNNPAYPPFRKAGKGQCLILETDSESLVDFNEKVNRSGLSSVHKTRC